MSCMAIRGWEDADQLQLTDKLLHAVLAQAQVVCIGQLMLIAGDLLSSPVLLRVSRSKFIYSLA